MENIVFETSYWYSLIPILITIILAVKTKQINIALFVGVFTGVVLILLFGEKTQDYVDSPLLVVFNSFIVTIKDVIFMQLTDSYNAGVVVLLVFIGGFVGLFEKSGAIAGLIESLSELTSRKGSRALTQIATWASGILVFFSELGTPLIVGPTFEPLYKKLRISKEKLAWILDTTASPVSVLVPFIGWGIYSIGLIRDELINGGMSESLADTQATTDFIKAIPLQVYPILSVIMVPVVIVVASKFGMEFKAMAKAENEMQIKVFEEEEKAECVKGHPIVAILPLIVMFATFIGLLIPFGFPKDPIPGSIFRSTLITAYLFATFTLVILLSKYKVKTVSESVDLYFKGTSRMMSIVIMLILAWALSSVGKTLGTADFIASITETSVSPIFIPALIFITGAIISFSTGTSWGTFAILMPIAFALSTAMDVSIYPCIAAVLSGGLFGDHCSPISDTTILSSAGAKCEHISHVRTQLPYAFLNGIISIFAFIILGMGASNIVTVFAIFAMIISYVTLVKAFGTKVEYVAE